MLGGCVAAGPCDYDPASCQPPPQPYAYAPPPVAYSPPVAYAPPGSYEPGPPPGQAYVGPDGLTYVDGYPVDVIDNQQVELVFVPTLGGWGYYDGGRRWRGAPPDMRDRLDRYHPRGEGLPPPGRFDRGPGPGRGPGPAMGGRPGFGGGPPGGPAHPGYPGPGYPGPGRRNPGPGPASYGGNRPGGGFQGRPQAGPQAPQGRPQAGGPPSERRPPPPRERDCQRGQQRC